MMGYRLRSLLCAACLLLAQTAMADTEVITIDYLPLDEAAAVVKSQLSEDGRVGSMPSRRILIVDDDASHISRVRALLKRLDVHAEQYQLNLEMRDVRSSKQRQLAGQVQVNSLSGGWVQLSGQYEQGRSSSVNTFLLRLSSGREGSMEVGSLQPVELTRSWLAGYGVVQQQSVELVPITSGFTVMVRPAGEKNVHVRITPWMQRQEGRVSGRQEMLLDMGTTRAPQQPPSAVGNVRLNARPVVQAGRRIVISGAATELDMERGSDVVIAASSGEAKKLGSALLGAYSSVGNHQLEIRLRID